MLTAGGWNRIVSKLASDAGMDEAIAPFGFEVGQDSFTPLQRVSRLFLFYKGSQSDEQQVLDRFLGRLRQTQPGIYANIGVAGSGKYGFRQLIGQPRHEHYFLAIERIETALPILESYSRYIASAVFLMAAGWLPEQKRAALNPLARLRIRQLFKISCWLYEGLRAENRALAQRLDYRPSNVNPTIPDASAEQLEQVDEILSACREFCSRPDGQPLPDRAEIDIFGGGGRLTVAVDGPAFKRATRCVSETYGRFYA